MLLFDHIDLQQLQLSYETTRVVPGFLEPRELARLVLSSRFLADFEASRSRFMRVADLWQSMEAIAGPSVYPSRCEQLRKLYADLSERQLALTMERLRRWNAQHYNIPVSAESREISEHLVEQGVLWGNRVWPRPPLSWQSVCATGAAESGLGLL